MSNFMENGNKDLQQYQGQGATASQLIEWLKAGTANIANLKATTATVTELRSMTARVTVTATTEWAAFAYDTEIFVNSSSATTQDITNGAATAGTKIWITNISTGAVTIDVDGTTNYLTLGAKATQEYVWSGTAWCPLTANLGTFIVESGSNANGSYIKWSDGTMECWARFTGVSLGTSTAYGSPASSTYGIATWTLPASFVDTNYFYVGTARRSGCIHLFGPYDDAGQKTVSQCKGFFEDTGTATPYTMDGLSITWHAIGRWTTGSVVQYPANVIESGSNANGNWIKYPDGTLVQWGRHAVTASLGSYTINFPISFLDINYIITSGAENGTAPSDIYVFFYSRSTSAINDYLRGPGWPAQTNFVNWHAIGKWK